MNNVAANFIQVEIEIRKVATKNRLVENHLKGLGFKPLCHIIFCQIMEKFKKWKKWKIPN